MLIDIFLRINGFGKINEYIKYLVTYNLNYHTVGKFVTVPSSVIGLPPTL